MTAPITDYRVTLVRLRELRKGILTPSTIEDLTVAAYRRGDSSCHITVNRLRDLENSPRWEPFYDEALLLSRLLLLPGITPLITPGHVCDLEKPMLGPLRPRDVDDLRRGYRLPLSTACRLTIAFGLDDPVELERLPVHQQIWSILANNERGAPQGSCPWCMAPNGNHLSTCLPDRLWGHRSTEPYDTSAAPKPERPRTRGDARKAYGLKVARVSKGVTQIKLASDSGIHPNYYSRIERCEDPLTMIRAERLASLLGVPVERLFLAPPS